MSTATALFLITCALLCVSFVFRDVEASLPEVHSLETHIDPREHELALAGVPVPGKGHYYHQREPWTVLREKLNRLPGVCKRLRRRRITILCNVVKYCCVLQCNVVKYCSARRELRHGQLCRCPRGSRCSHFFLRSL